MAIYVVALQELNKLVQTLIGNYIYCLLANVIIMKATIKGFEKGRYTEENRNWLKENIGKTFEYEKHNINYVRFSNGFLCHIYECYCA